MSGIEPIVIRLDGTVRGKGRPRFARVGQFVRTFTDAQTRTYEGRLSDAAAEAMDGHPLIEGPVLLKLVATFGVPASWSKRKQADALTGIIRPTGRPDWENIAKLTDALNGIVWRDDAQVVTATVRKVYGERPGLAIEVVPIVHGTARAPAQPEPGLFAGAAT